MSSIAIELSIENENIKVSLVAQRGIFLNYGLKVTENWSLGEVIAQRSFPVYSLETRDDIYCEIPPKLR